jgi:hypothetical protein
VRQEGTARDPSRHHLDLLEKRRRQQRRANPEQTNRLENRRWVAKHLMPVQVDAAGEPVAKSKWPLSNSHLMLAAASCSARLSARMRPFGSQRDAAIGVHDIPAAPRKRSCATPPRSGPTSKRVVLRTRACADARSMTFTRCEIMR